ncbi:MAG: iron ABC transporter permease [Methanomethylophilus sp.]
MNGGDVFRAEYIKSNRKKVVVIVLMAVVAAVSVLFTLGFGVYSISLADALTAFFDHIRGTAWSLKADHYIWDIRLPRALGALVIGAGLAFAGAIMQNDMRNPLAEPYTMGIASGAFLGAVLSLILGFSLIPSLTGDWATVCNAFIFSLIPTAVIVVISRFRKLTPTAMILVGIALLFIFSSISQVIMVAAPSESMADAYNWRVGTLSKVTWENLPIMAGAVALITIPMYFFSSKLDVMYLGDRAATTLGVNANRVRIVSLFLVSLMTAAIVSFTGTIGFIGLVGPHVARILVGSRNCYLLPASATFGALFIILADTVAKVCGASGLPVGVISAMIGGPLFIYILIRQKKSVWM